MLPATDPAPDADLLRIPVGPGAMHVDRYGHGGTPIVLLHGFGTSCFLWRTVGPALASARHTAYGVDLFGYGESDRPFDAEFGIAAQAEYLDRALTALRVSSAVFEFFDSISQARSTAAVPVSRSSVRRRGFDVRLRSP